MSTSFLQAQALDGIALAQAESVAQVAFEDPAGRSQREPAKIGLRALQKALNEEAARSAGRRKRHMAPKSRPVTRPWLLALTYLRVVFPKIPVAFVNPNGARICGACAI